MLIFGTNLENVNDIKSFLSSNFDMKDMGEVDVILGIKITRDSDRIMLSQGHYIERMLKKFDHFDCTPVFTPYAGSIHLRKDKNKVYHILSIRKSLAV